MTDAASGRGSHPTFVGSLRGSGTMRRRRHDRGAALCDPASRGVARECHASMREASGVSAPEGAADAFSCLMGKRIEFPADDFSESDVAARKIDYRCLDWPIWYNTDMHTASC